MENNIPTQVCSSSSLQSFSVIQFRGQEPIDHDRDEYHKVLKDAGVGEVDRIPVLFFKFKNLQILKQQLLEDQSFTGIILTSPRAVEAVEKSLLTSPRVVEAVEESLLTSPRVVEESLPRAVEEGVRDEGISRLKETWRGKHVFCVGPRTGEEARSRLGLEATLDPELIGDGHKLGLQIVSFLREESQLKDLREKILEKSESKENLQEKSQLKEKLLLPCSTIGKLNCVEELKSEGVEVVVSFVYETTSFPDACERLREGVERATGSVVFLVMFSPSNFKAILPELKRLMNGKDLRMNEEDLRMNEKDLRMNEKDLRMNEKDLRIIAVGPTTKKAIEEEGIPVWSTCPSPTPLGLLRALHQPLD